MAGMGFLRPFVWQLLVRRSPEEYRIMDFSGRRLPVSSSCWFNTGHMTTSVYGGFYGSDYRKLWSLRSCSPSRSSTFSSWCPSRFPWVLATMETPSCASIRWSIPFVAGRAVPCRDAEACPTVQTVCQTIGITQLLHTVFGVPVYRSCRFSLSWCRGRFPWSCCSADHRNSPVACTSSLLSGRPS